MKIRAGDKLVLTKIPFGHFSVGVGNGVKYDDFKIGELYQCTGINENDNNVVIRIKNVDSGNLLDIANSSIWIKINKLNDFFDTRRNYNLKQLEI